MIFQLDLQGDNEGRQLQEGWDELLAPNHDEAFKRIMAPGLVIEAEGEGGFLAGRAGGNEFNDLDSDEFPFAYLHGDLIVARSGNGKAKMTFENLEEFSVYTLTVWHNSASDTNSSFSHGQTIRPEVLKGRKILAKSGIATNFNSGVNPENSNIATEETDLKPTIIRFRVTSAVTVIRLNGSNSYVPMSCLQLKKKR